MKPRSDQVRAAKLAAKLGRGTISMVTGYGKSLTMALLIQELQVRTLVVVPSLSLKVQLTAIFNTYFGATSNIVVENIASASLKFREDFDALIIDEVHHGAAKSYHKLNKGPWKNIYYRFGFTATPFRNEAEEELLLKSISGDVIYKVDYKAAVEQGAIVPVEAYYLEIPKTANDLYTWREVYNELVIGHEARNEMISNLLINLKGISTLCLVKEISHGNLLSAMTDIPFVSGEDEESRDYIRQFNNGEITSLIGTTGVLGEGIDTKPAEFVIIAGLGKAKSAFLQQIGRGVRKYGNKESCKVILILDRSHKFTLTHFKTQVKVLKDELGIEVIKLGV